MSMEKIVLLTGGSSGIGRCAARRLADAGCRVYELSRRDSGRQASPPALRRDPALGTR